jgi:hypothetical protein
MKIFKSTLVPIGNATSIEFSHVFAVMLALQLYIKWKQSAIFLHFILGPPLHHYFHPNARHPCNWYKNTPHGACEVSLSPNPPDALRSSTVCYLRPHCTKPPRIVGGIYEEKTDG